MIELEHVLAIGNELGEGPLWSQDEHKLYWVDIMAGHVHRMTPGQNDLETFALGQPVGALGFHEQGGFIAALKTGFILGPGAGQIEFLVDPEADKPQARFNDGAVDRRGGFGRGRWLTTRAAPCIATIRMGRSRMQTGVTCSTASAGSR
jgi:sugar lactone lactonase YvrE